MALILHDKETCEKKITECKIDSKHWKLKRDLHIAWDNIEFMKQLLEDNGYTDNELQELYNKFKGGQ